MTKKTTAPKADTKAAAETLYGSDTLPAVLTIGGQDVQLGTVVASAHAASGLSVAEWNALAPEERDVYLNDQVASLEGVALQGQDAGQTDPEPTSFASIGIADPSGNEGIEGAAVESLGDGVFRMTATVDGRQVSVDFSTPAADNVVAKAALMDQIVVGLLSARAHLEPQADTTDQVAAELAAAQPEAITIDIRRLVQAQGLAELVAQEGQGYGYVWNGQALHQGVEIVPSRYAEGSIEQFKALDRRTMRIVMTTAGLAAVAVQG